MWSIKHVTYEEPDWCHQVNMQWSVGLWLHLARRAGSDQVRRDQFRACNERHVSNVVSDHIELETRDQYRAEDTELMWDTWKVTNVKTRHVVDVERRHVISYQYGDVLRWPGVWCVTWSMLYITSQHTGVSGYWWPGQARDESGN